MARRRMTLRRIDPWSILKFGFVVNVCLLAIGLLVFGVLWFAVRQLGLIEQVCQLAIDIGFQECGVNGTNLFRLLLLFGILGVIVQTGLFVFFAFLHNLIADLVGGVSVTLYEEGVASAAARSTTARTTPTGQQTGQQTGQPTTQRSGQQTAGHQRPAGAGSSAGGRDSDSEPWRRTAPRRSDASSDERLFGGP